MNNAYEVCGDGITTSIIERGKIIYGKTPMDALKRAGIEIKRRLKADDATPHKWIYVQHIEYRDQNYYYPAGYPRNFYEV